MKKEVLLRFIQEQRQKTTPVVSNQGFLNGAPAPGTNYRIPSDTLYNPTPHRIKAVSDNGIQAELQPYDETNVHFPGAQYVDEYEMRYGGLYKFLPKAQGGLEAEGPVKAEAARPIVQIPADADRYGIDAQPALGTQWVDQDLVNRRNLTQDNINKGPRYDYEQGILNAINRLGAQNFEVANTDYMPESVKQAAYNDPNGYGSPMYCISGVCYTINDANVGEDLHYYSNSAFQDAVKAGEVPNWKLNYDTNDIKGGDIVQFAFDQGHPHHAGLVKPGSIFKNSDGTISFTLFMNGGTGTMFEQEYTVNPSSDKHLDASGEWIDDPDSDNPDDTIWRYLTDDNGDPIMAPASNEHIQLITRDFGNDNKNTKLRNWLDQKIKKQDPQFFTRSKGAESRWQTYSPGMFAEKGKNWITMNGETVGVSTPTMMQNTDPGFQEASRLLTTRSFDMPFVDKDLKVQTAYDVDYKALSEKAGFNQILNKVNDENFKKEFMKRYNISNREYNGIVSNTFGIYGQETGFGTKAGGFSESDFGRSTAASTQNLIARWMSNGLAKGNNINPKTEYSRGLTQVKLKNLSDADMKLYGITPESVDTDPEKAFVAAMIANAQNLPQLRKLAAKGETAALDESNYLDFLPYLYSMPGRLRRGDKKTVIKAIDEGISPEEAIVQNPNNTNNEYVRNVRTFANMFQHYPTTGTMEIKRNGGQSYENAILQKFIKGL